MSDDTDQAGAPHYWMHETSGKLRPAILAYLHGGPMSLEHVGAMRAYLRQWIMAPVWDQNPHMDDAERGALAELRRRIDYLLDRHTIALWLNDALLQGHDPL